MLKTSVLFLIFNRPDTTFKVFEQIRAIKPERLYIAADGPRPNINSDNENCKLARSVVNLIDWDCQVKTLFRESNLGCGKGVSDAITWFFNQVDEGIILEDDCLPDNSFFIFCEQMLGHYRNNQEIMHIGGVNYQDAKKKYSGTYYFSSIAHVWGWATWKRAWNKFSFDINGLDDFKKSKKINYYYQDTKIIEYWYNVFERMSRHEIDTWDYQWTYSIWQNNGLCIIPNTNLVSNIGFEGTHADGPSKSTGKATHPIHSIHHPDVIKQDEEADIFTFYQYYYQVKPSVPLLKRILRRIVNV